MRIQFTVHGGFAALPGLRRPVTLDLDALPTDVASEVRRLVDTADFFALPAKSEAPAGAADYREMTITVEDGRRKHTVTIPETVGSPAQQALVNKLESLRALGQS